MLAVCFLSLAGIISPQWRRVWWGKPAHVSTKGASRAIRGGGGEQGGGRGSRRARVPCGKRNSEEGRLGRISWWRVQDIDRDREYNKKASLLDEGYYLFFSNFT